MRKAIIIFLADKKGSAALEYSLVVAALAIGILTTISSLGDVLGNLYQTIVSGLAAIAGFLTNSA